MTLNFRVPTQLSEAAATALFFVLFAAGGNALFGQSSNQNFPTAITSSEISGLIPAREIGDARLTTYYYVFEGSTGDVFINVATRNFNGDIDIFAVAGQRLLTKVVVYADFAENETGRVIYLRKPERLLLRVQGRSPGDDSASFRIKFAGSFVAMSDSSPAEPELPKVVAQSDTGIRVNAVGTIIKEPRKSGEPTAATSEGVPEELPAEAALPTDKLNGEESVAAKKDESVAASPEVKEAEVAVNRSASPAPAARRRRSRVPPRRPTAASRSGRAAPPAAAKPELDPLANIRLVITFKDGKIIERPMNEVFKFSVDKGILTIIGKDGRIGRYSILEVDKVTIQ